MEVSETIRLLFSFILFFPFFIKQNRNTLQKIITSCKYSCCFINAPYPNLHGIECINIYYPLKSEIVIEGAFGKHLSNDGLDFFYIFLGEEVSGKA